MAAPERDGSKAELSRETVTRPRVTTYPRLGVTRQGPGRGHEAACRGEFTSPITSRLPLPATVQSGKEQER